MKKTRLGQWILRGLTLVGVTTVILLFAEDALAQGQAGEQGGDQQDQRGDQRQHGQGGGREQWQGRGGRGAGRWQDFLNNPQVQQMIQQFMGGGAPGGGAGNWQDFMNNPQVQQMIQQFMSGGGANIGRMFSRIQPAPICVEGDYLYIVRGNTLYQFDAKELKLVKKAQLEPEETAAPSPPAPAPAPTAPSPGQ